MSEPFIGEIALVAFNYPPRGYSQCDGQLLAIAQNQALFAILGTTFGGNGTTNFALPDLRGRAPISWGTGPQGTVNLGQIGGEATHTLQTTELPSHTHPMTGATAPGGTQRGPQGNYFGRVQKTGVDASIYVTGNPTTNLNGGTIGPAGGSQPHNNMQPYLTLLFVIALTGIFPSRN